LLDVFVYVALYGWGMSWRSDSVLDATDRLAPVAPYKAPRMTPPTGSMIVSRVTGTTGATASASARPTAS